MSVAQFVTFDFVEKERRYIMKFTEQGQINSKLVVNKKQNSEVFYRNELNCISFPNFTAMEFNIFFTIIYYILKEIKKNGGIREMVRKSEKDIEDFIEISFDELRIFLPHIKDRKRFNKSIIEIFKNKLRYVGSDRSSFHLQKEKGEVAAFFKSITFDEKEEKVGVKLNPLSYSVLGEFGNFMSFDMEEFCSFENKYTKSLFRLLKQYENLDSKQIIMSKEEFQIFINAPVKYDVVDLERKTIVPSINEMKLKSKIINGTKKNYSFVNVDYEKIYSDKKRVKGFKFVFEKRNDNLDHKK